MPRSDLVVVGAGPAGLAAALAARSVGMAVIVFEKNNDVGCRFYGDYQGLENWTTDVDVLDELECLGIEPGFEAVPVYGIVCFDHKGTDYPTSSGTPIFYLVRRGSAHGALDQALKDQVLNAGITIRFGQPLHHCKGPVVVAEGPHRADVIAIGYVFKTEAADGCYVALNAKLAPGGYSYLLVHNGTGTVASCLYRGFHDERRYVEATLEFFDRQVGLRWREERRFGGTGNYQYVERADRGSQCLVGESAGFQDALFGFGLRYALISGLLAGKAHGRPRSYDRAWRSRLRDLNRTSMLNRRIFDLMGDLGRAAILRHCVAGHDPRRLLQRIYAPTRWKLALSRCVPKRPFGNTEPVRGSCNCTWCRYSRKSAGRYCMN